MRSWYQIQAKADRTAEIYIFERIGQDYWGEGVSAKQFIMDLNKLDVDNITLHINSPGGSVFEGNAIYNALVAHKATIRVKIGGIAASIASVIAMAGKTIEMPENAMMMIHDPSGMVMGTAEDMLKMAEALEKVKTGIVSTYHTKSKKDRDELAAMMSDETWLTAAEAVEHGLADQVTERVNMQANFDGLSNYRNVPAHLITALSNQGPDKEENKMDITIELLRAEHPEIVDALVDEGRKAAQPDIDAARTEGAAAERERIQAVQAQTLPGHEQLIGQLMFDGKTTGPEAALKVLAAEKTARDRALADHADDAPAPADQPATDDAAPQGDVLTMEDKADDRWKKDKNLRAEFSNDFDAYLAYCRAMDAGSVKKLKGK